MHFNFLNSSTTFNIREIPSTILETTRNVKMYFGKTISWIKKTAESPFKNVNAISSQFAEISLIHSPISIERGCKFMKEVQISVNDPAFQKAFHATPKFDSYKIALSEDHPFYGIALTGLSLRPSNLFFAELFKDTDFSTTMPASGKLFSFNAPQDQIRHYIKEKSKDTSAIISFSARDKSAFGLLNGNFLTTEDLSSLYGTNCYQISFAEIQQTLDSQKIYTSSLLPLPFYRGLKAAMLSDGIVTLPGDDYHPVILKELHEMGACGDFLQQVCIDPKKFGFSSLQQFEELSDMTLYQIGSMVVKSEDYHIFMDGNGKIMAREPGKNDAIRLINSCGIRGLYSMKTDPKFNKKIMTENFKTDLIAAERGAAIFPAVGMGIWGGDPDLYWKAFLDAVVDQNSPLSMILVNPSHQKTRIGKYINCQGEEFQSLLDEYKSRYIDNEVALARLNKIVNLHGSQKDIVQLSYQLKLAYPEISISLFNASDPDVSLGFHVGEYVNNCPHTITTEENYTAMGTNGLCFEGITGVHQDSKRLIQT